MRYFGGERGGERGTVLIDERRRADHLLEVGIQIRFSVISWM